MPEETTTSLSVSQIRWTSVSSFSSFGYSAKIAEDFGSSICLGHGRLVRSIFISFETRKMTSRKSCFLYLGPLKTLARPPNRAWISPPLLPAMVAPTAAPPITSISIGKACRITPMLPPEMMNLAEHHHQENDNADGCEHFFPRRTWRAGGFRALTV